MEVRLTPPQIAVQSSHHYINHGGSEMVVYRVTPADAVSGVRVGDIDAIDVVDGVGRLWLTLVFRQGHPRRIAFRMLS